MYRQGDVLLEEELLLPDRVRLLPHKIVARGELTGHAHRFEVKLDKDVELYQDSTGNLWIRVNRPSPLVHEEHSTLWIEPGTYRYLPQREYWPMDNIQVAD